MCDVCNYTGEMTFESGSLSIPCPGCDGDAWGTQIKTAMSYLYDLKSVPYYASHRSSYGMKHEVEDLVGRYVSNEDLIRCGVSMGLPHKAGTPNYTFYLKSKFPPFWLTNRVTTRPKGARKEQWQAYQRALEWAKTLPASHTAPTTAEAATGSG